MKLVLKGTYVKQIVTVVHTALTVTKFVENVSIKINVLTSMEHASLDAMLVTKETCVKKNAIEDLMDMIAMKHAGTAETQAFAFRLMVLALLDVMLAMKEPYVKHCVLKAFMVLHAMKRVGIVVT